MKTKTIQLALVIAFMMAGVFTSNRLQAQVTIGGDSVPKPGTILDLNSKNKGGLLFPNVAIISLSAIPEGFTGSPSGEDLALLRGMVVYNTYSGAATGQPAVQITPGLYVWTGAAWHKLTEDDAFDILKGAVNNIETVLLPLKANAAAVNDTIGSLSNLTTEQKTSVVVGINEVNTKVGTTDTKVGNVNFLTTTAKTAVTAINELDGDVGDVSTLTTTARGSAVLAINEVNGKVGTLDTKVGSLTTLSTNGITGGSIVDAMVNLKEYAGTLSLAHEVVGSPYSSYDSFTAATHAGHPDSTYATPVFAYVTFPDVSPAANLPTSGNWSAVNTPNATWRLDYSPNAISLGVGAWSPTTNMTMAVNANLSDGTETMFLEPSGNLTVTDWLQNFHNNLEAIIDKFNYPSEILTVSAGGTGVATAGQNTVFAGSASSPSTAPSFRKLALADLPSTTTPNSFLKVEASSTAPVYSPILASDIPVLDASKITTGTLAVANGGTNASTPAAARSNLGAQEAITSGTGKFLTPPTETGGQPGTASTTDYLQAPVAQSANTQLMFAPADKGGVPTLKALSTLGISLGSLTSITWATISALVPTTGTTGNGHYKGTGVSGSNLDYEIQFTRASATKIYATAVEITTGSVYAGVIESTVAWVWVPYIPTMTKNLSFGTPSTFKAKIPVGQTASGGFWLSGSTAGLPNGGWFGEISRVSNETFYYVFTPTDITGTNKVISGNVSVDAATWIGNANMFNTEVCTTYDAYSGMPTLAKLNATGAKIVCGFLNGTGQVWKNYICIKLSDTEWTMTGVCTTNSPTVAGVVAGKYNSGRITSSGYTADGVTF